MTVERCREWREQIGSLVLGHLEPDEQAALEAHIDGCASCRAEAKDLGALSALLPLADPSRETEAKPSPHLGDRIAEQISHERKRASRRRGARRAVAAVAATFLIAVAAVWTLSSGGSGEPDALAFSGGSGGVRIAGSLHPGPLGTQIRMQVTGVRSGTLCRVFLSRRDGKRSFAGTFRYRYEHGSPEAVLSSALDLSSVRSVGVRAAGHTFIVPIGRDSAAEALEYQEMT